jgi:acyl carrier protein
VNTVEDLCALISRRVTVSAGTIEADTRLLETGLLDSMAVLNIVAAVEQEAGVDIPESQVVGAHFRTPGHLWELVRSLRGQDG